MNIPKVFISYSHDTQEHKRWVLELTTRLRNNGIDAILDQFELQPGDDLPHFMESNLAKADKILMICTNKYVEKANDGQGGVGYEKMIITSHLLKKIDENKIVPLVRQTGDASVPTFLRSKMYINFSKDEDFEFSYDSLVRTIHGSPLFKKPAIGNNPFQPVDRQKLDGDIELLHNLIKEIIKEYEKGNNYVATKYLSAVLNISRTLVDIGIYKLIKLGYAKWYINNSSVMLSDSGKIYALENQLLK